MAGWDMPRSIGQSLNHLIYLTADWLNGAGWLVGGFLTGLQTDLLPF
jgi:hypothetical protein